MVEPNVLIEFLCHRVGPWKRHGAGVGYVWQHAANDERWISEVAYLVCSIQMSQGKHNLTSNRTRKKLDSHDINNPESHLSFKHITARANIQAW